MLVRRIGKFKISAVPRGRQKDTEEGYKSQKENSPSDEVSELVSQSSHYYKPLLFLIEY